MDTGLQHQDASQGHEQPLLPLSQPFFQQSFCLLCRFFLFFWKAAERCHLSQDRAILRDLRDRPGISQGGRKSLPQPCRAGPTTSTRPLTPVLVPRGAWDIFLRDQSFLCAPTSQMLKARGGPAAPMVTVMSSRQEAKGHFSMAKIGQQSPGKVPMSAAEQQPGGIRGENIQGMNQ